VTGSKPGPEARSEIFRGWPLEKPVGWRRERREQKKTD